MRSTACLDAGPGGGERGRQPAGPQPTTRTSVSWMTSIWRAGSVIVPNVRRPTLALVPVDGHGLQYCRSTYLLESVHASFTPRSLIRPLSVNFDLYGDQRCSSPTKETHT